jgi:dolichol-phosphate mannosyltransferase
VTVTETPTLVVLPSYNERLNIVELTDAILDVGAGIDVCIVDDASPDGTAAAVREAAATRPRWAERVHLMVRDKKDGRGGAVREGFAWGVARGRYRAFVEMDCDFSHEPSALPQGLALLDQGHDVVIGSRYPDGTVINTPLSRRLLSRFANMLARTLIDRSIADYTTGYRFYRPGVVQELLGVQQQHRGYIYLSETISHVLRAGHRVGAFPICYRNRERGVSNTSLGEVWSSLRGIVSIAIAHRFGRR